MIYHDIPVIIPIVATGYVLTIYLLLILAERTTKISPMGSWPLPPDSHSSSVH